MAVSQTVNVDPAPDAEVLAGTSPDDPLLDCLSILTRLHGRPLSNEALAAGLPVSEHGFTPTLFLRAAEQQDYAARVVKRPLKRISNLLLPAVLLLGEHRACVLTRIDAKDGTEVIFPETVPENPSPSQLAVILPLALFWSPGDIPGLTHTTGS